MHKAQKFSQEVILVKTLFEKAAGKQCTVASFPRFKMNEWMGKVKKSSIPIEITII